MAQGYVKRCHAAWAGTGMRVGAPAQESQCVFNIEQLKVVQGGVPVLRESQPVANPIVSSQLCNVFHKVDCPSAAVRAAPCKESNCAHAS